MALQRGPRTSISPMEAPPTQRSANDAVEFYAHSTGATTKSVFTYGTQQNKKNRKASMRSMSQRHWPATPPTKADGHKSKSTAPQDTRTLVSNTSSRKRRADDPTHCLNKRRRKSTKSAVIVSDLVVHPLFSYPVLYHRPEFRGISQIFHAESCTTSSRT